MVDSARRQDDIITGNTVIGGPESIMRGSADGTEFIDNTFENPAKTGFEDCTGTVMPGNTGLANFKLRMTNAACFDDKSDSTFKPVC